MSMELLISIVLTPLVLVFIYVQYMEGKLRNTIAGMINWSFVFTFPLAFHLYLFSLILFSSIGIHIAIILFSTFMLIYHLRVFKEFPSLNPFFDRSERRQALSSFRERRHKFSLLKLIEVIFLYGVLYLGFNYLHVYLGFPNSLERMSFWWLPGGYLLYYLILIIMLLVFRGISVTLRTIFDELLRFKLSLGSGIAILAIYLFVDVLFASIYSWLSFHDEGAFIPALESFDDAFYFSTGVITTVGFSGFEVNESFPRLLVAIESIAGVILLVFMFNLAVSVAFTRNS